jgi:hypothetical protein
VQANAIPAEINAFQIFNDFTSKVIQEQQSVEPADVLTVHTALLSFALQCYAGRLDYVDHCLAFCSQLLGQVVTGPLDAASGRQVEKLLMVPLESLSLQVWLLCFLTLALLLINSVYNVYDQVLNLEHYPELMQFLHYESRKVVAVKLLKVVLER